MYTYVIIAAAVFSWLYAFGVVNPRNQIVARIGEVLYRITEPVITPIRRFAAGFGGIDLSPVVVLLLIFLIQNVIGRYVYPYVF